MGSGNFGDYNLSCSEGPLNYLHAVMELTVQVLPFSRRWYSVPRFPADTEAQLLSHARAGSYPQPQPVLLPSHLAQPASFRGITSLGLADNFFFADLSTFCSPSCLVQLVSEGADLKLDVFHFCGKLHQSGPLCLEFQLLHHPLVLRGAMWPNVTIHYWGLGLGLVLGILKVIQFLIQPADGSVLRDGERHR